jgi:hypothetical protein
MRVRWKIQVPGVITGTLRALFSDVSCRALLPAIGRVGLPHVGLMRKAVQVELRD